MMEPTHLVSQARHSDKGNPSMWDHNYHSNCYCTWDNYHSNCYCTWEVSQQGVDNLPHLQATALRLTSSQQPFTLFGERACQSCDFLIFLNITSFLSLQSLLFLLRSRCLNRRNSYTTQFQTKWLRQLQETSATNSGRVWNFHAWCINLQLKHKCKVEMVCELPVFHLMI